MTLYLLPESMGRAAAEKVDDHAVPGLVRVRLLEDGKEFDMPREMLTEIPDEPGPDVFAVMVAHNKPHYYTSDWWRRDDDATGPARWVDPDGFSRTWPWLVQWCLDHYDGQLPTRLVRAES